MKTQTTVAINDLHGDFYDPIAFGLVIDFIKREKPDNVVLVGDIVDFYKVSRFDKNPNRIDSLQNELDFVHDKLLKPIRQAVPEAKIHYVEGNHELRLRKYLWRKAAELASLRVLNIKDLLGLKELDITYHEKFHKIGDLYFFHGDVIRKHSGYTARAMYEKHGITLLHGHSHRDGKYTVRTRKGQFAVWENYCLCVLNPEYVDFPNWSQGFAYITHIGNRPFCEQIPIISGSYIFGSQIYSAKEKP